MARGLPKPWSRTRPNGKVEWYVTISAEGKQKQIFLAEGNVSDEELHRKLLLTLSASNLNKRDMHATFVGVMNQYLDFVQQYQSQATYALRAKFLTSFYQHLASTGLETISCKDLLPYHTTQWLMRHRNWSSNSRRIAIITLKTCLNWAFKQGLLKEQYLPRLDVPPAKFRGQEVILTSEQRQLLLDHCLHQCQRDVLEGLYSSGCRPGELVSLLAEDVCLDSSPPMWIVRGKPTKHFPDGRRAVALTPKLVELSRRLLAQNPSGVLFRNRRGQPWTRGNLDTFVARLRARVVRKGHKLPVKVIPYGLRHCYATDMLRGGAHDYDVAKLMGHTDTSMVHAVYGKHNVAAAARALSHLNESTRNAANGPARNDDANEARPA